MMNRPTQLIAGLALVAAFGAQPVQAQTAEPWGTFIGASIGDSDYDTGYKLFGGQQFHPNLAWEAQYTDFGERNERRFAANGRASAWAVGGSLVGLLPLSAEFTLFGKIGAHYSKIRWSGPGGSASDTDIELGLGAGLSYRITPALLLRAEIEDVGKPGDLISVGLQLRF